MNSRAISFISKKMIAFILAMLVFATVVPAILAHASTSKKALTPLYFTVAVDTPVFNEASLGATQNGSLSKRDAVTIIERIDNNGQHFGKTNEGKYLYMDDLYFDFQRHLDSNRSNMISFGTHFGFFDNVKSGGKWDFKYSLTTSRSYNCLIGGKVVSLTGEQIGNIHYGYVGSTMFAPIILFWGAGIAHVKDNEIVDKDGNKIGSINVINLNLDSYGDDPKDKMNVQQGIDYYNGKNAENVFGAGNTPYQSSISHTVIGGVTDVTRRFANKSVCLKSVETSTYVCGENNSTVHVNCRVSSKGIFDTTLLTDGTDDWLGFHLRNGKWLSVQNLDYLRTEGDQLKSWECFKVYQKGNDYFLLSRKNTEFVQVSMNEPSKPLQAARPYSDGLDGATWERFKVEEVSGSSVAPQPSNPTSPSQSSPSHVTNQHYNRENYDKGKYTGDWSNGVPHGYGTLIYDGDNKYNMYFDNNNTVYNAREYVGNWSNGQKYGNGVLTYTNGSKYNGDWNVNGVYFYGYYVMPDGNNRHKLKMTLGADRVTTNPEWIGDWEYVGPAPTPAPTPTPAPPTNPTPASPPKSPEPTPYTPPQTSGWTKIENIPLGATVTERKWTYSVADTFESTDSSVAGATKTSERWAQSGSGSREYANFPSGFDTSHSIYGSYDKAPVAAYDNGSSKREVTDSHSSYIYWHWTYEPGSPTSSVDNRLIQSYRGYDNGKNFVYFHAVVNNNDYPFNAGANACKWNAGGEYWTYWWYKLELRRSDYVDYTKYYTYSRTQETESTSRPSGNNITNIQEWVKYTLTQQISKPVEITPSSYISQDENITFNETEIPTSYTTEKDTSERNTKRSKKDLPVRVTADERSSIKQTATSEKTTAITKGQKIKLYIGFSEMDTPGGKRIPIDENGTSPIIQDGRTLLPVRAIIESMGGTIEWDNKSNPNWGKVTCELDNNSVQMWIGHDRCYVNGRELILDVPPQIINDRTLIPARALFEAIGCQVEWEENANNGWDMVTITY